MNDWCAITPFTVKLKGSEETVELVFPESAAVTGQSSGTTDKTTRCRPGNRSMVPG